MKLLRYAKGCVLTKHLFYGLNSNFVMLGDPFIFMCNLSDGLTYTATLVTYEATVQGTNCRCN